MTSNEPTRALAVTAARYWADRLRRIMQHPGTGVDPEILEAVRFGPPDAIAFIPLSERLRYIERGKLTEERIQVFEAELTAILEGELTEEGTRTVAIRNGYQPHPLINEAARRSEIGNPITGYTMTLLPKRSHMFIVVERGAGSLEPGVYVYFPGETAAGWDQLPLIQE